MLGQGWMLTLQEWTCKMLDSCWSWRSGCRREWSIPPGWRRLSGRNQMWAVAAGTFVSTYIYSITLCVFQVVPCKSMYRGVANFLYSGVVASRRTTVYFFQSRLWGTWHAQVHIGSRWGGSSACGPHVWRKVEDSERWDLCLLPTRCIFQSNRRLDHSSYWRFSSSPSGLWWSAGLAACVVKE